MKKKKRKKKKNTDKAVNTGGVSVNQIEKLGRNSAKKKIILSAVTMTLFFAILIIFSVMTVLGEKASFSELENRYLANPPKFTAKEVYKGSFSDNTEKYISDHFFCRDSFLKFKTYANLFMGKSERNDVYITKSRLAERVGEPNEEKLSKNIDGINAFANDNSGIPVYFLLAPTAGDIYYDEMPQNAPMLDQKNFIDNVYGRLSDNIIPIDVHSVMTLNKDSYIYYRTDHHWTSYGAYLAYAAAARKMGFAPTPLDSYDIEHASDSFRGTLYSMALYDGVREDTIDYYHIKNGCNIKGEYVYEGLDVEPVFYDSIYFRSYLDVKDKYSSFTGSNQPVVKIISDSPGGRLLVIKDSYAHSLVPFLMQNYSEVTMLDMRYVNISYKNVISMTDYDAAMFVYNVSSFVTDENLKKLIY